MKTSTSCQWALIAGAFSVVIAVTPPKAEASAQAFVCATSAGVPTTLAVTSEGSQVPVIRWTSKVFEDAGWSQERRCQEVSRRFDTYLKQGRLAYITTGRINGLPVICAARTNGGACDGLLYTLKPGQDATSTLKNLLDIRVKARGPLNETNSRLYVAIDDLVGADHVRPSRDVPAKTRSVTTNTGPSLW